MVAVAQPARSVRLSVMRRLGKREGLYSLIIPAIFYGCSAFAIWYAMWPYFYYIKNENFVVLGLFALWRYGWMLTNYTRAMLYTFVRYPHLRRCLEELPENERFPRELFFVIPSYKEEAWVTLEAFHSIFSNLADLDDTRVTLVVATGSDDDDRAVVAAYNAHPVRHKVELVLQRQKQGKRIAMGHALRAVARRYEGDPNSVCIFMDGDSYLPPDTLKKSLPFFVRFADLGAATTNEAAFINSRSIWYKEWFNLKFGQRHILFKSHALSNKVLTLTGRFSLFRTSIVTSEAFISQIENDTITHWMHGKFRFLMGDDKSSWFHLLEQGWNMLYLHDVVVYSLESRDGNFFKISLNLPYRWYGNTLRNNARALKVGWKKTGFFIWLAILDQRLSMWTSLVGITGAIMLSLFKSFIYLPFYIAWVLLVRVIQMSIIAWRGHPVSMLTIPLMLYNQWVGALIKIKAAFHLADQSWSKGGAAQGGDVNHRPIPSRLATWLPEWSMFISFAAFIYAMMVAQNVWDLPRWPHARAADAPVELDARRFGIVADDGRDDAAALNQLLDYYKDLGPVTIRLPAGVLNLDEPIRIPGHYFTLEGDASGNTHLWAAFPGENRAMITAAGKLNKQRFSLEKAVSLTDTHLALPQADRHFSVGDWLLLSAPNTEAFLQQLGSRVWKRQSPRIRQVMLQVRTVDAGGVVVHRPVGLELAAGEGRVQKLEPIRGLRLSNLKLSYLPGEKAEAALEKYENLRPDHRVDGIALQWVTGCTLANIQVEMAGRHPLNLDGVAECKFRKLVLQGSWNKGKGGNGYLRVARSHHNRFEDLRLENLRHLAIQWSSSHNHFLRLRTRAVDVNFHGGYSRHNVFETLELLIPATHPWPPVYRTPDDARWAPPDGPGNTVYQCRWRQKEENPWESCDD